VKPCPVTSLDHVLVCPVEPEWLRQWWERLSAAQQWAYWQLYAVTPTDGSGRAPDPSGPPRG
jgi:hypothetical protein